MTAPRLRKSAGAFVNDWLRPLLEASLISLFILSLFYYWFGVANRHVIFLYGHKGENIPVTQPFDAMTSGRYWMAGLVASGMVMVLYGAVSWLRGRIASWRRRPCAISPWWRVWCLTAVPLAVGIPVITMTLNSPTLPWPLAAACAAVTLLGLAVALSPGAWAVERPRDLLWLIADGAGLALPLLLVRAIELPGRRLSLSPSVAWGFALGSILAGVIWLAAMSALRFWRRKAAPGAASLALAGVGLSYLLGPVIHYLLAPPPGYRYISTSSNFFALGVGVQLLTWAVVAVLAIGVTAIRRWFAHRKQA